MTEKMIKDMTLKEVTEEKEVDIALELLSKLDRKRRQRALDYLNGMTTAMEMETKDAS